MYVTLLKEKATTTLDIPYESPQRDFRILHASDSEVFCVLTLTPDNRTTDAMAILGKEFGQNITTRNWRTINKMMSLT